MKKRAKKWKDRILSGLLCWGMIMTSLPVLATGTTNGLCEHHPVHTADCGYAAASEGSACGHVCGAECYESITVCVHSCEEGNCSYQAAEEPTPCGHIHDENCGYAAPVAEVGCGCVPGEDGTTVHAEGCGYVAPIAEAACGHSHDEDCGYSEGTSGVACDHVCSTENGCVSSQPACVHTQHDANCGYAEAVEGQSCTYSLNGCTECNAANEEETEETEENEPMTEATKQETEEIESEETEGPETEESEPEEIEETEAVTEAMAELAADASVPIRIDASNPSAQDGMDFFANGMPLYIAAGTDSGMTVIYYKDGSNHPVYLNKNGAKGEDLSEATIFGGRYAAGMDGNVNITMTGGTVQSIFGGCYYVHASDMVLYGNINITISGGTVQSYVASTLDGTVSGNSNITIKGGNITAVYAGAAEPYIPVNGDVNLTISGGTVTKVTGDLSDFPITGTTSGYIASGTLTSAVSVTSQFDHLIYKNGSSWTVHGNPSVPEGCTMTIGSGETATIPAGSTVTNHGSIVNNGTMYLYGTVVGNPVTGNGMLHGYTAYFSGISSTSGMSAWINGVKQENLLYTVSNNTVYLWLPSGNAKVTVNGTDYYGVTKNGASTPLISVSGEKEITGIPETIGANTSIPLNAVVFWGEQESVLEQTVTYEMIADGTTAAGAEIRSDNTLYAANAGTIRMKVTASDTYFTVSEEYDISVTYIPAEGITLPSTILVNQKITLPEVTPADASYKEIRWDIISGEAEIKDGVLTATKKGTVTIKASVENGQEYGETYTQEFVINVQAVTDNNLNISVGNIVIEEESDTQLKVQYQGFGEPGYKVIHKNDPIVITGASENDCTVSVMSGEANIILNNCSISSEIYENSPLNIASGAAVNLTLEGDNHLKSSSGTALAVPDGARLTIGGTGSLNAIGGGWAPGIGAKSAWYDGGTIIINSGTVTSTGGSYGGAGISDWHGVLTINGGVITANGIGEGNGINGGTVNIHGGRIAANSGTDSLSDGIEADNVTITGGTLTAVGGSQEYGDGIQSNSGSITITGGNINASSFYGSRYDANQQTVSLNMITLEGVTEQTAVTAVAGVASGYGMNDVVTLDTNKLYLYLPGTEYSNVVLTTADGTMYTGDITGGNGTFTRYTHTHEWNYTVSDTDQDEAADTITATCVAQNCLNTDGGNITLSAPEALTYTGSPVEAVVTSTLQTGDDYTVTYTAAGEAALTDGKPVKAGTYTAKLVMNDQEVELSKTYTIAPKVLETATVEIAPKTYDNTTAAELSSIMVNGVVAGEVVNVTGTAVFEDKNAGTDKKVFVTDLVLGGADAANYALDKNTFETTGTISPAELTITITAGQSKVYGQADPDTFAYTITSGALLGEDTLTGTPTRVTGENAGTYVYTQGTLANSNYKINLIAEDEFRIAKAVPDLRGVTASIEENGTAADKIYFQGASDVDGIELPGDYTVTAPESLVWGSNTVEYIFAPSGDYGNNYEEGTGSVTVTVIDTIVPSGEVRMESDTWQNTWQEFLNTITFDLLFNKTVDVTVTAADTLSGVAKVEYCESAKALSLNEIKAYEEWLDMKVKEEGTASVSVTAEDAKQFVYYIRITDNAGNVTYLSSDGATFDTQAPVVTGITDGSICYTTQKFVVAELHPGKVMINGTETADYVLPGNVEAEYKVVVTDALGNTTEITVLMKPLASLTDSVKDLTAENVTAADTDKLQKVEDALAGVDTANATEEEKAEIAATQEKIDSLNTAIESLLRVEDAAQKVKDAIASAEGVAAEDLPDDAAAVEMLAQAKETYEALTEKEKVQMDAAQVQRLEELYEKAVDFKIIKGMDGVYTKGTSKGLEFTANGAFELFFGVRVNGEELQVSDYTAKAGSTVVTLNADYLKTLENGEHSLEVVYEVLGTEYIADGTFTVQKAAAVPEEAETEAETETETEASTAAGGAQNQKSEAVDTGDDTNVTGYLLMMAGALMVLLISGKKKRNYAMK